MDTVSVERQESVRRSADISVARHLTAGEIAQAVGAIWAIPADRIYIYVVNSRGDAYLPPETSLAEITIVESPGAQFPIRLEIIPYYDLRRWTTDDTQELARLLSAELAFCRGYPHQCYVVPPGRGPIEVEYVRSDLLYEDRITLTPEARARVNAIATAAA